MVHANVQENLSDFVNINFAVDVGENDHTVVVKGVLEDQFVISLGESPIEGVFVYDTTSTMSSLISHEDNLIGEKFHVDNSEFSQYEFHLRLLTNDFDPIFHVSSVRRILHHQWRPPGDIDISPSQVQDDEYHI